MFGDGRRTVHALLEGRAMSPVDSSASVRLRWSVVVGESTYLIDLVGDGAVRIFLQGRLLQAREAYGSYVFSLRGQQASVVCTNGAWWLYYDGKMMEPAVLPSNASLPPAAPSTLPPPASSIASIAPAATSIPPLRVPSLPPSRAPRTASPPAERSFNLPMSRGTLIALLVTLLFLVARGTHGTVWARPAKWEPSWRDVRSEQGLFSARLPAEPIEWTERFGASNELHAMTSLTGNAAMFGVAWTKMYLDTDTDALALKCQENLKAFIGVLRGRLEVWSDLEFRTRNAYLADGRPTCELAGMMGHAKGLSDIWHQGDVYSERVAFAARVWGTPDGRAYIALGIIAEPHAQHPDVTAFFDSVKLDDR